MTVPPGEAGPTARALLALETVQNEPGITAERLARSLGVSDRAARRYVGILRDAGIPIESTPGRYGGYRTGRGVRLPPLMFTATEALGLALAVLEGHGSTDPADPVGSALAKITRVLPETVAAGVEAARRVGQRHQPGTRPDPTTMATLVRACASHHRVRLDYRRGADRTVPLEVDPWAVIVRYGRWYVLGWSHTVDARRILRVDRVVSAETAEETFSPPVDLDPVGSFDEHLADGWEHRVEVLVEAPVEDVARWVPRRMGRLEPVDDRRTRIVATTEDAPWYATQLAAVRAPLTVVEPDDLREEVRLIGTRMLGGAG